MSVDGLSQVDVSTLKTVIEEADDSTSQEILDIVLSDYPEKVAQAVIDEQYEVLSPEAGLERFRKDKKAQVQSSSFSQYETKLDYIEEYLTDVLKLSNLNNLTPIQAREFQDWRQYESLERSEPLSKKTLKDDLHLFREFLSEMVVFRAVDVDTVKAVNIPSLKKEEAVDDKLISPERIAAIIEHLETFHYASREHVVLLLFTKTGRRPCDLHTLDLQDFDQTSRKLQFVHQPNLGTQLKEGTAHEATITLSDNVARVLSTYIKRRRHSAQDEYDRKPLITTRNGRIAKSTMREYVYRWTRPCVIGEDCPHEREQDTCQAASSAKKASQCPSSKSPKTIRSGYITAKFNSGASPSAVGYRVGATKEVLRRNYDHPDQEAERQRYEQEIMTKNDAAGGFANTLNDTDS